MNCMNYGSTKEVSDPSIIDFLSSDDNHSALGYLIMAAEQIGVPEEEIQRLVNVLYALLHDHTRFDLVSLGGLSDPDIEDLLNNEDFTSTIQAAWHIWGDEEKIEHLVHALRDRFDFRSREEAAKHYRNTPYSRRITDEI